MKHLFFDRSQICHVFYLNLLVLRFDYFQVIFICLSLLSESLSKVLSFLSVLVNSLIPIVMGTFLKLPKLVFKGSLLHQQKFSFIAYFIFALLNFMLILEVISRNLVRFVISYLISALNALDRVLKILFFQSLLL